MRVLIQWAASAPADWTVYDINNISDARRLPRKPLPTASSSLDAAFGWYAAINIQGVLFDGYDHVGFELVSGTLIVKCWNDDLEDFPVGTRWGQVWQIPVPFFDSRVGQVNVEQSVTWYGEADSAPVTLGVPNVRPWAEFVPPPSNTTIHGVWMTDAQWAAHEAVRSVRYWREWVA